MKSSKQKSIDLYRTMIDSCPVWISFLDEEYKYVIANDENGATWNIATVLHSLGDVGRYSSLVVVNGNPAISLGNVNRLQTVKARPATTAIITTN